MLRISLLGVLRLEVDGVERPLPSSRRARLLLAMLALERRAHSRETLAARLWPEVLDASARVSLRTALVQLRAALGSDAYRALVVSRERVALAGPEEVWTDVGELERLLDESQVDAALALWGGDLLTGLEEDWIYERRDELRGRLAEALRRRADEAEAAGDLETALRLSRRQTALDPLAEEPQRELMRRLAASGDRSAALAAYKRLTERLRRELHIAPSAATRELAEAVRAGAAADKRLAFAIRATAMSQATAQLVGEGRAEPAHAVGEKPRKLRELERAEPPAGLRSWGGRLEEEPALKPTCVRLPFPRQLRFPADAPFVGRERELQGLRNLWRAIVAGEPTAVFLAGEAGIGKTRLTAELARAVQVTEGLVLCGRCDEGLAAPYQPFVQALGPYARALGWDRLQAELGPLAAQLGRLLPELQTPDPAAAGDPESERFALFEAIDALLELATRERRALLVLDDLHWATTPTLLLLRHLVRSERRLALLMVGCYRETDLGDTHPLTALLADLERDASAPSLRIGPLDEHAVAALFEATTGEQLDERALKLVPVLRSQTAGNPFFIRELLSQLVESGAIYRAGERWTADVRAGAVQPPERLRQVIGQRVARLSRPTRRALSVAAVAGPTFSLGLLERVLGDDRSPLDALEEALAAGLLVEAGPSDYAFAHALVRQTIYGGLSSARRLRLHRQLGEALEALDQRDVRVEALAYHFAEAAADGQVKKAAAYALAAGQSAIARLGYEEAAAHYERGLKALELTERPDAKQRCELLLALAEARLSAGARLQGRGRRGKLLLALGEPGLSAGGHDDPSEARPRAAERTNQTGFAAQTNGVTEPQRLQPSTATNAPVVDLLEQALASLGEEESAQRARVISRLARVLAQTRPSQRTPALVRQALQLARDVGDKATLADVLATTYWTARGPDNLDERLATSTELAELAAELAEGRLEALAHFWSSAGHLELGDIDGCQRELTALERLAEALGQRYPRFLATQSRATQAYLAGRLEESAALAHDALTLGLEARSEQATQRQDYSTMREGTPRGVATHVFAAQMMLVRREQDRLGEFIEVLEGFASQYPEIPAWRCVLASAYAQLGHTAQAQRELEELGRADFSDVPRDGYWLVSVSLLCEVVAFLGDARRAQVLDALLLPYVDRCVLIAGTWCEGSASRPLGMLATTQSHFEQAARYFDDALEMNARIRSPLWVAHTQHDYAHMLLLRDGVGDRPKARKLLGEALAAAERLGLKALADRARQRQHDAEAALT